MSEAKNPLPSILVGVVVVFVLVLVGYAGIAKMIEQINPTNTTKLVRTHKCKVAYKTLSKAKKDKKTPDSAKWAAPFLRGADAAQVACMAGTSATPAKPASASKDKAPARRAPEKRADARPSAPVAPGDAKKAAPDAAPDATKKADPAKPAAPAKPVAPAKPAEPVAKAAPDTRAPAKRDAAKAAVKALTAKAPAKASAKPPKPLTAKELAAKCKRVKQAAFIKACAADTK